MVQLIPTKQDTQITGLPLDAIPHFLMFCVLQ
jgi:hypothetical protein